MKNTLVLTSLISISSLLASGQVMDWRASPELSVQDTQGKQDELDARVRNLLKATGAADMGKQVMDAMMDSFRNMPSLQDGFIEKFKELAKPADLIDIIVPIYKKHLDVKTIDAAIAFFATPAGKKFIAMQPVIVQESMTVGRTWGEELAKKVMAELNK